MEGMFPNFVHENKTKAGSSPAGFAARFILSFQKAMGVGEKQTRSNEEKINKRLELIGYDVKFKEQIDREVERKQEMLDHLTDDIPVKQERFEILKKEFESLNKELYDAKREVTKLIILRAQVILSGNRDQIDQAETMLGEARIVEDEKKEQARRAEESYKAAEIEYQDIKARIRGLQTGYLPLEDASGAIQRDAHGVIVTVPPITIGMPNPFNQGASATREDVLRFAGIDSLKKMSVQVKTAQMKEYLLNESQSNYNIPNDPRYIKRNAFGDVVSFHADQKAELRTTSHKMIMALGGAARRGTAAFVGGMVASGGNPLVGALTGIFAAVWRGSNEFSKTGEVRDYSMDAIMNSFEKLK